MLFKLNHLSRYFTTLITSVTAIFILFQGFDVQQPARTLKGTWQFNGGVYNGKPDGAPKAYKMQRKYTDNSFAAFALQKGYKTEKYEAGKYVLKGDSCFETSTFSSRPSQLVGKTVAYGYKIKNNELVLSGTLPSGMVVEEHWNRVRTK
jgi:predicted cupin superfamily sugar epimerase